MHTDNGPMWLQIIIAVVPLVAAIIGGIFLLTNTINRRVERFKNLVEASKDNTIGTKGNHLLHVIIVQQLMDLWQDTMPAFKQARRLRSATYIPVIVAYFAYALLISNHLNSKIFLCIIAALPVAQVILNRMTFKAYKKRGDSIDEILDKYASIDSDYKRKLNGGDQRQTPAQATHDADRDDQADDGTTDQAAPST